MKLHTVFVTYERLDLSKRSVASYLETVTVPFTLAIVDNGSSDGTQDWLRDFGNEHPEHQIVLLASNKYPGYACNRGWELAPADADFLHRADNDWTYLPGWCDQVETAFRDPTVGQVGLRTDLEEALPGGQPVVWNVGGNNVIRRKLWDEGLRYDERPWTELPRGCSEDTFFSPAVVEMGYSWKRVAQPCIVGISIDRREDPYYRRSWGARRIYGCTPE